VCFLLLRFLNRANWYWYPFSLTHLIFIQCLDKTRDINLDQIKALSKRWLHVQKTCLAGSSRHQFKVLNYGVAGYEVWFGSWMSRMSDWIIWNVGWFTMKTWCGNYVGEKVMTIASLAINIIWRWLVEVLVGNGLKYYGDVSM